jgi:hypothetical protein
MDTDKLKSRIREALGAAGIGREISGNIDGIIDSMAGKKDAEKPELPQGRARQARQAEGEPTRFMKDEDDDAPARASAKMAVRPARKTKAPKSPRRKK